MFLSPFVRDPQLPRDANIIVIGGGGLFLEIEHFLDDLIYSAKYYREDFNWTFGGVLDIAHPRISETVNEWFYLGGESNYNFGPRDYIILGIGDPILRRKIINSLSHKKLSFFNLIHPTACIAKTAKLGSGIIIGPFCYIAAHATIGNHVLMHSSSQLGHDSKIGDFSVLCPYSSLSGYCEVGHTSFLGTGASMVPGSILGSCSKISAGVFQNQKKIEDGSLVYSTSAEYRRIYKVF